MTRATGKQHRPVESTRPQVERFKDVARQIGADESEAAFEDKLKAIAKAPAKAQKAVGKTK
jgi:hypothetical protein